MKLVKTLALLWITLLAACAVPPAPPAPAAATAASPLVTPAAAPGARKESPATASPIATPRRLLLSPEEAGAGGKKESPVLVYHRQGGLANSDETWALYADGRLVDSMGQTTYLPPGRVEQLLQKLEMFGFFELDSSYLPDNPCCDRMTHTIAVRRHGQVKRVTTMDGTPEMPAALQNTLSELWQLFKPGLSKPPVRSPGR